ARITAPLDRAGPGGDRGSLDRLAATRAAAAPPGQVVARVLLDGQPGCAHERTADRGRTGVPAAPGLGVGRRDRAHAVAALRVAAPAPRVAIRLVHRAGAGGLGARGVAGDVAGGDSRP